MNITEKELKVIQKWAKDTEFERPFSDEEKVLYEKILGREEKPSMDNTARLADAFIAVRDHDWEVVGRGLNGNRKMLVPPLTDERRLWTAIWDEDGLPHFLPKFTKGEK